MRKEFLGVHITEDAKRALEQEAQQKNISISQLATLKLMIMLSGLGYSFDFQKQ